MTTITVSTSQEAIAAVSALILLIAFVLSVALGWLRFSVSIGAIPPWNRKPTARKTDVAVPAAAGEAPAGTAAPRPISSSKRGSVA